MASPFPDQGRLAGVDYGAARVGVALCDPLRIVCSPWSTLHRGNQNQEAAFFRDLVRDEAVVGWVVGLPVYPSGDESPISKEARRFAAWLGETTQLPVVLHDERFSTSEARGLLQHAGGSGKKKKQRVDQVAAQVILQSWIERHVAS